VFYSNFVPKTHRFWDIRVQIRCDLENRVRGHSRSLKVLLVFCGNFVPKIRHFWDIWLVSKYTVSLKPRLGVTHSHRNNKDQSASYDFLLTFHSNHEPISYRFRDKRRFQSNITNSPTRAFCTPVYYRTLIGNRNHCIEWYTFNDLEWPRIQISRSRHFSTLNISEMTRDRAIQNVNRKSHVLYRMVTCPMTLTDP